jgi:hypothetical protein
MSEDPKGFDAGDYNLFRYCGNDPEDRTDPMGLMEIGGAYDTTNFRHIAAIIDKEIEVTGSHIPRHEYYAVMRLDSQDVHMGQTQRTERTDSSRPEAFRIVGNLGRYSRYSDRFEYQAETANGKPAYTSSYLVTESTKSLRPSDTRVLNSDRRWAPLFRGKWDDQVGPPGARLAKPNFIDIREQRFSVKHIGDTGNGTPMHSVFLHVTIGQDGVVSNGVYDVTPGR